VDESPSETRITLLGRLAGAGACDQAAWEEFVQHYGGKVYRWCRRWGLQEADGYPFLALEYLDGGTLAQRLRDTLQSAHAAAQMLHTLALAIHHAHERGIVHRDLKPSNVLVDSNGTLKISDFGLAKQLAAEQSQTRTGEVVGTPSYMAPEQLEATQGSIGPTADIWALGAILYEMLTGRPPFRGESVLDTLEQVRIREPVPPSLLQPGVPRDLETICLKCLQKNPWGRFSSAAALADDLRRFLEGRPILAKPVTRLQRGVMWARRQPVLAGLLAMVVILTITAWVSLSWGWQAARDRAAEAELRIVAEQAKTTAQRSQADHEKRALERERELRRIAELSVNEPRILLAEREWQANNLENARALLDKCRPLPDEPDLRGWEWFYLDRLCRGGTLVLPQRFAVTALAFSFDDRWLAVGTGFSPDEAPSAQRYEVKLWDPATGREHATLLPEDEPSGEFTDVGFSPDNRWTWAFQALLPTWYAWEIAAPHRRVILPASGVSFLPDGTTLAVVGRDGALSHVDLSSGKVLRTLSKSLELPASTRLRVAFDPVGRLCALRPEVGQDVHLVVLDVVTGELRLSLPTSAGWLGLALSPDGKAVIDGDRRVDLATGEVGFRLEQKHEVRFNPTGDQFARGWYHDEVRLHDAATGDLVYKLGARPVKTYAYAPHPSSPWWATTHDDGLVRLWDAQSGVTIRTYRGHRAAASALAFSRSGRMLASGGADKSVHVWDCCDDQRGVLLAAGEAPAAALRTRDENQQLLQRLRAEPLSPEDVVSPNQQMRASARKGGVALVSTVTRAHIHFLATKTTVQAMAFHPDNRRLAVLHGDAVSLWDLETGHEVLALPMLGISSAIATSHARGHVLFSSNGKSLAAQLSCDRVIIWNIE